MSSNRLRLNSLKTQYIWLGTRQQLAKLDLVSLTHEFPTFVFSTSVRDLGVILDQELSFTENISSLSRSCFYQLHQLRVVSRSLLLLSLPWSPLCSLATFGWCTQSRCYWLVGGVPKFGHIGEFMRDTLRWLLVRQPILYRVSTYCLALYP